MGEMIDSGGVVMDSGVRGVWMVYCEELWWGIRAGYER